MQKCLIVKEDGLIYAAEVPEEPKRWEPGDSLSYNEAAWQYYKEALASAKDSAVLVADQEKARELVMRKSSMGKDKDGFYQPTVGVHPIPDLQWEIKWVNKKGGMSGRAEAYAVAILKESTPSIEQDPCLSCGKSVREQLKGCNNHLLLSSILT